jgi:hypothetical protein
VPPARGMSRSVAVATVLLVTLAGSLAGCSNDDPAPSAHKSASPSATAQSPASSPSPSPSSPAASRSTRSGGPLLTAKELPGLGSSFHWSQGATTTTEPRELGPCQRFGILAIGAERVVVRHYSPADATAGLQRADELVATFPDEMTARRAYSVLESWRKQCGDRLRRYGDPEIGDLQPVPVDGGQAAWYLLTYAPDKSAPNKVLLDAQGMAQVGPRIALLRMTRLGERSGDLQPPIEDAVAAAADRLR